MSDYAVKIGVRNGRILRRMEQLGIQSQAELARMTGHSIVQINELVALRKPARKLNGDWGGVAMSIASFLQCDPEDIFTEAQSTMGLKRNTAEVFVDEDTVRHIAANDTEGQAWARLEANRLIGGLGDPRQVRVVRARMDGATLDEIGGEMGLSTERVRQIEMKAHRKMRAQVAKYDAPIKDSIRADQWLASER